MLVIVHLLYCAVPQLAPNCFGGAETCSVTRRYVRDMPMSWEVLLENVTDPAHVAFSHHGVQGELAFSRPSTIIVPFSS
jgi:phenylpropionate dioxygenase-like ring-hydroxylating dioxygenase large terminal subunit